MRALVTITTCQRLHELKKNIVPYLDFCSSRPEFDFVVSLDGTERDYLDFCLDYGIPLVHSDEREGAGLARNRVCVRFPGYDYYIFVDDDVEIMDESIFLDAIRLSQETGNHHLAPTHTVGITKKERRSGQTVLHSAFGGGYFMLYSQEALCAVGGWHTLFAKYRRFGHTEHSYRVFHQGLNAAPFVFSKELHAKLLVNDGPSVSTATAEPNENHLIAEEQDLVDQRFAFLPLTALSNHYFNGCPVDLSSVDDRVRGARYKLVEGEALNKARGRFLFERFVGSKNPILLIRSYLADPSHKHLRHYLRVRYLTHMIGWGFRKTF